MASASSKWSPFFYPNDCYVCRTTENLQRCGRCRMISYCSVDHQKEHWPVHKKICKEISIILKEENVSHIFEELHGVDSETWREERFMMTAILNFKLNRPLSPGERGMFLYPRACFVCHEARQEMLQKCAGCPYASFCDKHPSSFIHNQICTLINKNHKFQKRMSKIEHFTVATAIQTIVSSTPINESLKIPTSIKDYLYRCAQTPAIISKDLKVYTSLFFSRSLTLFTALQKLNYNSRSRLVVHVGVELTPLMLSYFWEVLLHFLPNLIELKIVLIEHVKDIQYIVNVCKQCRSKEKTLVMESVSATYTEYLKSTNYIKPDVVALYNYDPPLVTNPLVKWNEVLRSYSALTCPWFLTTVTKEKARSLSENLRSNFKNFEICYDGKNDFVHIIPSLDWETEGICWPNQFLTVLQPKNI